MSIAEKKSPLGDIDILYHRPCFWWYHELQMFKGIFLATFTIILLVIVVLYLPFSKINWGRISILPAATITVTGTAQSDVANSVATFGATVTATNADKQTAINTVNTKMTALITSVKNFGIADADIKTDNVSVYQLPQIVPLQGSAGGGTNVQTQIYPLPPVPAPGNGDWQASNSITITLRDVSKASGLSDILNNSGATNIYGPNLRTDTNTTATDTDLLSKAVANAKSKAESIAKAGGQTLGAMINVQEEGTSSPIFPMTMMTKEAGSSGTPVQPGTSTLSKSVTVIFELK